MNIPFSKTKKAGGMDSLLEDGRASLLGHYATVSVLHAAKSV